MAWKFNYNQNSNTSEFNEAFLKIRRLHELQDEVNRARVNPLLFLPHAQKYGFEVWFQNCNSLLMEVIADLEPDEQATAENLRKAIREHMINHPVFNRKKNVVSGDKLLPDNSSWNVLEEYLTKYESLVRTLLARHGYGTKYADDDLDSL